jgi:DNA-binding MarR family transcriptional regulator
VTRLEAMGLVARTRSSNDRRRVELEVTEEGLRVLRSARSRRTAWLAQRIRTLGEDDARALADGLAPLRRLLESAE